MRVGGAATRAGAAAMVLAWLAGCAADPLERNRQTREIATPVAGVSAGLSGAGFIGSRAAEIGLGTAGFVLALALLPYLEQRDMNFRDAAIDGIVERQPGDTVSWENPHTGSRGELRLVAVNMDYTPETCRDIQSTVFYETYRMTEYMLVCRLDSGWYIRKSHVIDQEPVG